MVFFYSDFVIINRRYAHEMYFYPQYAFRKLFTWCTLSGSGRIMCREKYSVVKAFAPGGR